MLRMSRFLLVAGLVVFALACNFVTQPIRDAQDTVSTVQSVASALPLETIQAFATSLPVETLQAISSEVPDFGNMFNPQGEPVSEWNGIPIMPQATAGQEHDANNYSFKFTGTAKEAQDFYEGEMSDLGWTSLFSMPSSDSGALLSFQKDNKSLTITIVTTDDATVVVLTMAG
ncbi:MAG TPA: hypothetical protein VFR47_24155 [Anaerolineales bacterium]|nr:hypothetical protein [Anaerolineales bacterium]